MNMNTMYYYTKRYNDKNTLNYIVMATKKLEKHTYMYNKFEGLTVTI